MHHFHSLEGFCEPSEKEYSTCSIEFHLCSNVGPIKDLIGKRRICLCEAQDGFLASFVANKEASIEEWYSCQQHGRPHGTGIPLRPAAGSILSNMIKICSRSTKPKALNRLFSHIPANSGY
jgi:hypothetical protein